MMYDNKPNTVKQLKNNNIQNIPPENYQKVMENEIKMVLKDKPVSYILLYC